MIPVYVVGSPLRQIKNLKLLEHDCFPKPAHNCNGGHQNQVAKNLHGHFQEEFTLLIAKISVPTCLKIQNLPLIYYTQKKTKILPNYISMRTGTYLYGLIAFQGIKG